MALGVGPTLRAFFLGRLSEKGVTLLTGVSNEEVTPKGLVVTTREGERRTIEADTIVLAVGSMSEKKLYEQGQREGARGSPRRGLRGATDNT